MTTKFKRKTTRPTGTKPSAAGLKTSGDSLAVLLPLEYSRPEKGTKADGLDSSSAFKGAGIPGGIANGGGHSPDAGTPQTLPGNGARLVGSYGKEIRKKL